MYSIPITPIETAVLPRIEDSPFASNMSAGSVVTALLAAGSLVAGITLGSAAALAASGLAASMSAGIYDMNRTKQQHTAAERM